MRSVKHSIWKSRPRYEDEIEKSLVDAPLGLTPAGKSLQTHLWQEMQDPVDIYITVELWP